MQHLCKFSLSFPIPVLVFLPIPFPVYCFPSCPSRSIISLIFLTLEVLPIDSSLQHCQCLSCRANLVVIAATKLSAARLV